LRNEYNSYSNIQQTRDLPKSYLMSKDLRARSGMRWKSHVPFWSRVGERDFSFDYNLCPIWI